MAGLAAAKPAKRAAPKPAAPVDILVFFDFDSSKLTPEAMKIVRDAAARAKEGKYKRILLTGHSDRAGPVAYNIALSRRRADAVKAALERLGVPAGAMRTEAKGESEPLVPTDDGVPEAQNRRVEIQMR